MKETTGEVSMVIVTIVLIGIILFVARPMVEKVVTEIQNKFVKEVQNTNLKGK